MDIDNILMELDKKFKLPLPQFYNRRIIFWVDESKDFLDYIDDVSFDNARVIKLDCNNNFAVKYLLNFEDLESNFLVYQPFVYENNEEDWFYDMKLYSEIFRADLISLWINELNVVDSEKLRGDIKNYSKFFNAKTRRVKFNSHAKKIDNKKDLYLAIMATISSSDSLNPSMIIRNVLSNGLDNDTNKMYVDLCNYGAVDIFWKMVSQATGYEKENSSLKELMDVIVLTALTKSIRKDLLNDYDDFINSAYCSFCYDFLWEWLNSSSRDVLKPYLDDINDEFDVDSNLFRLGVNDLIDTEIFDFIDKIILKKITRDVKDYIIDIDNNREIIERRRIGVWFDDYKYYYEALSYLCDMQEFYNKNSASNWGRSAKEIWDGYTEEYYLMDTYYRGFHKNYNFIIKDFNSWLKDDFSVVKDYVEGLYNNWFLEKLGDRWFDYCKDDLKDLGYVSEIKKQVDFYSDNIKNKKNKCYVIISDAMRYEVAKSLSEKLEREHQCKISMDSMQAIFPTITKFGMAALLPHEDMSVNITGSANNEKLSVMCDGMRTDSNYRENCLNKANPNSAILKYNDIIHMKREQRQSIVKGKEIIYIYHDTIDSSSHNDENSVFNACDDAIDEIIDIVRMITNEFGGINVFITSDHGFLYTFSSIEDTNKVDNISNNESVIEYARRYAITERDCELEYLMNVKFFDEKYTAFTPRNKTRIRMSGAGEKFVHGGVSLQEMIVPLIKYKHVRKQSVEYRRNQEKYDVKPVSVDLLTSSHKISNMNFSLSFYQKESVDYNRKAAVYSVYFTDSTGAEISDVKKIIADKESSDNSDRVFKLDFNLKPRKYYRTESYYLVIAESIDDVKKEEFTIDIAEDFGELNFFD